MIYEAPHSCRHCQKIDIDLRSFDPDKDGKLEVELNYIFNYSELREATLDGCKFFSTYLHKAESHRSGKKLQLQFYTSSSSMDPIIEVEWHPKDTIPVEDGFYLLAERANAAALYVKAAPFNPEPGSEQTIQWIQNRLDECRRTHKICHQTQARISGKMPTRLIEVGPPDAQKIYLRSICEKDRVSYAVLSYCWGDFEVFDQRPSNTTKENLEKRESGFELYSLPMTIVDAIKIARSLKFKYLWVDAICIVQDDKEDIASELSKMAQIYAIASLTLVAARSIHSNEGIFQSRDLQQAYACELPYRYRHGEAEKVGSVILSHLSYIEDDPIDKRGWTLQEQLMSLRQLRYGSKQVTWECRRGFQVDGGSENVLNPGLENKRFYLGNIGKRSENAVVETRQHYRELVCRYSARHLTKLSDKLPAFSAIAESYSHAFNVDAEDYWAGLWKAGLPFELLWYRKLDEGEASPSKVSEPRVASWSWASLDAPVTYDNESYHDWGPYTLKILSCDIKLKMPGVKYGEVERGVLKVQGYVRRAHWAVDCLPPETIDGLECLPVQITWDFEESAAIRQDLWCLEVRIKPRFVSQGLILTKIDKNSSTFKRAGYFIFRYQERLNESGRGLRTCRPSLRENWLQGEGLSTIFLE